MVCSVAFFFSKLSGRHFSDDKVDLFFSLVVKGNQRSVVLKYSSEMPEESVLMWMQNMMYLVICYGDQSVSW